jgi:monoamine oxidase
MLCTLPLGVLQSGAVEFQPGLPDLAEAVSHLKVGCAQRVSLLFRSKFWAEDAQLQAHPAIENQLKELSFLFAQDTRWPTWWTAEPHTAPVITAWAAGPKAARLGADQLMESAVEDVTRIFSLSQLQIRENLLSARCHDWQADPYSRGAYSYVPSGAIEASARMCQPHADTLFFAGEHTDVEGHWGTVHAALNSGVRAAAQILQTR